MVSLVTRKAIELENRLAVSRKIGILKVKVQNRQAQKIGHSPSNSEKLC